MIRVVVDPGVFISALIGAAGSPPDRVVQAWIDDRIEVVVSSQLLAELRRVALRPKFRRWFDEVRARELIARIERQATVRPDPAPTPGVTRDPADDYLVALARAEQVDAIVSGDRDLAEAGIESPPVQRPAEFVARLSRS
ncbi:putative toxin-antitoxin system toxin component, PIN family [Conexibacter sp. CPCC 206217]|uniref:putative toxin-antitoxin system toxin component, PIN family n=1 Tax=Conexibacter sp. CPCC 206217 TaxID=3064574 RepID=UPI0027161208|nr:putative toxin-antitoxin system toxin component, PIN family [Conexibacter sp. CPCC 206217]MDO8213873.1 putative toxin-antitoxin system toxin component, PIN family [Conexibacter sp. CPCC 206217]